MPPPAATPREARPHPLAWWLAAAIVTAIALFLAIAPARDPDLPWHLRTGALALATRSTLPTDPFSSLFAGQPWRYKDLAGDVVLHLAVAAFGLAGLVVLDLLATAAATLGLALALPRARRSPLAVLVGAGLALATTWFPQRPNLFSWAAFPALVGALALARRRLVVAERPREMAAALAPAIAIQWAWVWLHRAAPIGFALFALLSAQLLASWLGRGSPRARAILGAPPRRAVAPIAALVAMLAAIALACANPSGLAFFTTSAAVAHSDLLRRYIAEHQPLPLARLVALFPLAAASAGVAIAATVGRLAVALRRRDETAGVDLGDLALVVTLLALTTTRARWLPFLALAAAIVIARLLAELASRALPRGSLALATVSLAALAAVARADRGPFTVREDASFYPIGAVDFAKAHGLHGDVANALPLGGYVIEHAWPDVRVLVDGRNDQVYPPEFVLRTIRAHKHPDVFEALRREDHATWVLATNAPREVSHKFLARDPRWALVYWSEPATIYVERAAHPELAPFAFRWVDDPDALDVGVRRAVAEARQDPRAAPALVAELRRMVDASPESVRANGALVYALHLLGPSFWDDRDRALDRLRAIAPDSEVTKQLDAMRGAGR